MICEKRRSPLEVVLHRQGEVYGQLSQQLDEMEQLRLKIDMLEQRYAFNYEDFTPMAGRQPAYIA